MPAETCNNCRYGALEHEHAPGDDGTHFHCHRYPPGGHREEWHSQYPLVRPTDWCGEFKVATP